MNAMNFLIELFLEILWGLFVRKDYPRFTISILLAMGIALLGVFALPDDSPWRMLGWPLVITGVIAGIVWERSAQKQKEAAPEMLNLIIKRPK